MNDYYRIKMIYKTDDTANGSVEKVKTEELVYASSYTDAEATAYALINQRGRNRLEEVSAPEIIRVKIEDLVIDDTLRKSETLVNGLVEAYFEEDDASGVGLYAVKTISVEIDERTGKEKRFNNTTHVTAVSSADAGEKAVRYLKNHGVSDPVIRGTSFDAASEILFPMETYKDLIEASSTR